MATSRILTGIVHGRTVELDRDPKYPDGQAVSIVLQPVPPPAMQDGEFDFNDLVGAWSDDAEELDEFLEWTRQQRKLTRPEVE